MVATTAVLRRVIGSGLMGHGRAHACAPTTMTLLFVPFAVFFDIRRGAPCAAF